MEQKKSLELHDRASKCDGQVLPLEPSYTAEEEKRLVRKINCLVLPLVSPMYLLYSCVISLNNGLQLCLVLFLQC